MSKPDYSTPAGQKRLMAESMGLPSDTYLRRIDTSKPGDYGASPLGDGMFRMVPSGDIVEDAERRRRLSTDQSRPTLVTNRSRR